MAVRRGGSYGPIHFTYALNDSQASATTITTNTTTPTAISTTSPLPRALDKKSPRFYLPALGPSEQLSSPKNCSAAIVLAFTSHCAKRERKPSCRSAARQ